MSGVARLQNCLNSRHLADVIFRLGRQFVHCVEHVRQLVGINVAVFHALAIGLGLGKLKAHFWRVLNWYRREVKFGLWQLRLDLALIIHNRHPRVRVIARRHAQQVAATRQAQRAARRDHHANTSTCPATSQSM